MRFVSLLGGGKDAYYAQRLALSQGHSLVCLATLFTSQPRSSRLFQCTSLQVVQGISQALATPLVSTPISGQPLCQDVVYTCTQGDEVEDLFDLLTCVKYRFPDIQAVVSGVTASNYHRTRIEDVCARLGLVSIAPLWKKDEITLLTEEIEAGIEAVVLQTEAMGLIRNYVGRNVQELREYFGELQEKFGSNMSDFGGEYHTLVTNSPDFAYTLLPPDLNLHSLPYFTNSLEMEHKSTHEKSSVSPPIPSFPSIFKSINHFTTSEMTAFSFFPVNFTNIEDETFSLFQGLKQLLIKNRLSIEEIYYVHVTLQDLGLFARFNKVYKEFFVKPGPPARCCVELSSQTCRVKMAVKGSAGPRKALHVQSISTWAPANVGPYSQAIEIQGKLHMAGVIALDPAGMTLAGDQVKQCMRNVSAVREVMGYDSAGIEQIVVYHTGPKPEIEGSCRPFYIPVTRIPKDGDVEIELHVKKQYPEMKTEEIRLVGDGFAATLYRKFSPDVLFAIYQVEIDDCANSSALLSSIYTHLEAYFASVPRKSPTQEGDLFSLSPSSLTILDYITEVRVLSPTPDLFHADWLKSVPYFHLSTPTFGLLISVEDRLQAATHDFIH